VLNQARAVAGFSAGKRRASRSQTAQPRRAFLLGIGQHESRKRVWDRRRMRPAPYPQSVCADSYLDCFRLAGHPLGVPQPRSIDADYTGCLGEGSYILGALGNRSTCPGIVSWTLFDGWPEPHPEKRQRQVQGDKSTTQWFVLAAVGELGFYPARFSFREGLSCCEVGFQVKLLLGTMPYSAL